MIDHYRERFPGCRIVVNDNMSTDRTAQIARANCCEVIIDTNFRKIDAPLTKIKNSCWKTASTDWVLVCDLDELLVGLEEEYLKKEFSDVMIKLQKSEQTKNSIEILKYLEECQRISQKINTLKTIKNAYEKK